MNGPGSLPGYDNWLEPPDDEEDDDDADDRDDGFIEPDYDDEGPPMGRRVEHGRTIYEEDFIYDPMRGDR